MSALSLSRKRERVLTDVARAPWHVTPTPNSSKYQSETDNNG